MLPCMVTNLIEHRGMTLTEIIRRRWIRIGPSLLSKVPLLKNMPTLRTIPLAVVMSERVAYVISGAYKDWQFRAFTYHFVGNTMEQTGPGGVFSVVMIECPQPPQVQLPEQVFYENGVLCDYQHENLNVETLHDRIEKLGELAKGL